MTGLMPTIMRMATRGGGLGCIGAGLGVERGLDLGDPGAAVARHVFDDGVAANAQLLPDDLRRQMAIAEMVGEAHELAQVRAADFGQRLGLGEHFDQASVLQHQRIAAAQAGGLRQVEQEFEAADGSHRDAAAMARLCVEHDDIGGIAHPGPARLHRNCPNHTASLRRCAIFARGADHKPPDMRAKARQVRSAAINDS